MKRIILALTAVIGMVSMATTTLASQFSIQDCNKFASKINKNFPMRVDSITSVDHLICLPQNNEVVLTYYMKIDSIDGSYHLTQNSLNAFKPAILTAWCTDPDQLVLLKMFPIKYKYFFDNGSYIGDIKFSYKNCGK
jgi:hypothetical protein